MIQQRPACGARLWLWAVPAMPALLGCARLCSLCPAGGAAEPAPAPGIKSREGAEKCDRDGAVGRGRKRIGGRRKKKKKNHNQQTLQHERENKEIAIQKDKRQRWLGFLGCGEKLAGLPEQQRARRLCLKALAKAPPNPAAPLPC